MPSVLFVCTANRIRSPLAEQLFRRQLEAGVQDSAAWRVASAGTWTKPGLPAMPLAQQAAAELGLDLSTHRSQPIDDIALEDYGLIITMEQGQQEAIRFAKRVAGHVQAAHNEGRCDRLLLVAGPPMLGLLREKMETSFGMEISEIEKNLGQYDALEIRKHLPERL